MLQFPPGPEGVGGTSLDCAQPGGAAAASGVASSNSRKDGEGVSAGSTFAGGSSYSGVVDTTGTTGSSSGERLGSGHNNTLSNLSFQNPGGGTAAVGGTKSIKENINYPPAPALPAAAENNYPPGHFLPSGEAICSSPAVRMLQCQPPLDTSFCVDLLTRLGANELGLARLVAELRRAFAQKYG